MTMKHEAHMTWWQRRKFDMQTLSNADRWALVVLVVGITLVMAPVLLGLRTWLPLNIMVHLPPWSFSYERMPLGNTLTSDLILKHYPQRLFYASEVWAGHLPLWNPYILSGTPLLAVANSSVWYPLTAVFALLPTDVAFGVVAWLHLLIGGVGAWVLARSLHIATIPALLVPIIYLGSGFATKWLALPTMGGVIAWTPVVMYGAIALGTSMADADWARARRAAVCFGAGIVLAGLSQPDTSLYVVMAGSMVAVGIVWSRQVRQVPHMLAGLVAIGVAVFGLMAPQILPTVELGLSVSRAGGQGDYSPLSIVTTVAPELLTSLHAAGDWGYKEGSLPDWHIGLLPLLLWLSGWWLLDDARLRVLAGVALLCVCYALSPVWWWQSVPLLSQFRELSRAMLPASLLMGLTAAATVMRMHAGSPWRWQVIGLVPVLALVLAFGYAWWVTPGLPWRVLASYQGIEWLWPSASVAVFVALWWRRFAVHSWMTVVVLAVVATQLWWYWRPLYQPVDPQAVVATTDLRAEVPADVASDPVLPMTRMQYFLQRQPGLFRIFAADYPFYQSNTNMVAQLYDVRGFDSLIWGEYAQFVRRWEGNLQDGGNSVSMYLTKASATPRWLDLTNVRYVLFRPNSPLIARFPGLELVHQSDEGSIYFNPHALPRAYMVHQVEQLPDERAVYARLRDPQFPMGERVVTEAVIPAVAPVTGAETVPVVQSYQASRVVITGVAQAAGVLVLSDTNYPGWRATLNGATVPIATVNGVFRGVWVPAGAYEVVFWYWPTSLSWGLALWATTVGVLVSGGMYLRRRVTMHR